METIEDTIEFKFVDEGIKTSFSSTEEALEYVKKKKLLPRNGHSWRIDEIHHKVISHTFESERQVVDNTEITKKIIDYFLEHATIDNVQFDNKQQYFNNPEHRNFRYHDQLYAYLCCKQYLGYSIDQFVELYKRLYVANCDGDGHAFFGDICELCCYYAMKDKYGVKEEDICLVKDPKFDNLKIMNPALEENEAAKREVNDWTSEMYMADGGHFTRGEYGSIKEEPKIWRWAEKQETLDMYKEALKSIPVEKMKWSYNVGDYKPCHNYKLDFIDIGEEIKREDVDEIITDDGIHMWGLRIPGIMFRGNDIIITYSKYYGRNVNLRSTKAVDVDEKLYEYCIKNLK